MAMVARGMNADDIDKLLGKASGDGKPVKDPMQSLANYTQDGDRADLERRGVDVFFLWPWRGLWTSTRCCRAARSA